MNKINFQMNRERMVRMLETFDKELHKPLKIVITGASALIIHGCITRASKDIDVLNASEDLKNDEFIKIIENIAIKYSLDHEWLNNKAEATFDDLPGYKPDLIRLKGDFKYLEPYVISKADSVITKFARFTNIRSWDESDIKDTEFNENDFKMIRQKLDFLYIKDPERALRIEIKFKATKPEFIKTDDGFRFSNSSEVARYALKRFGIKLDNTYKKHLDEDVVSGCSSYEKSIIQVDNMAISNIFKEKSKRKK
jgi:hypothetical protein